jgi:hypothetical protein
VIEIGFQKGKREYRAVGVQVTAVGGNADQPVQRVFEGRPIVFDTRAPLFVDDNGMQWYEQIHHDALNGVDLSDVALKYNHSQHVPPLASTRAGTLDLNVDGQGMGMVARVANTTQASDIHELVRSGHLDKMSFAFVAATDDWNYKTKTRTIFKFSEIPEVSIVDRAVYNDAKVSARSRFMQQGETRRRESKKHGQEVRAKEAKEEERKLQILKIKTML